MNSFFERGIFVIGPTASGKTAFAHRLAEMLAVEHRIECELINCDAFQFYRGMDVGAAKPPPHELERYNYRGVDILDPLQSIDAAEYAAFVWAQCRDISALGKMPICVGGSGLYLRAVLHGLDPLPPRNDELRRMLRASAAEWGWPLLHDWLKALAPTRAGQLHPNDKTRIERALEIVFQLPEGVSPDSLFSHSQPLNQQELLGNCYVVHIECSDAALKTRIDSRLDEMFSRGWIAEVRILRQRWGDEFFNSQAGKAIGYREIDSALVESVKNDKANGIPVSAESLVGELKAKIATLTWQYVRRQRTWNAKEHCDWKFDSSGGIVDLHFPASFLSFLKNHTSK
ncbi:MAG: tRNA (adenosine(37)-N6)-dimethylallyltransferase MiaA [Silvanigrellaceae bacterium]